MIKTGCDLFEEYGNEITCIYGRASSGKTTLAKLAAIEQAKKNKRVVYVDTENGFSVDRIKQLSKGDLQKVLENIILFKPKRFAEQNKIIRSLLNMRNISLIVIDTISHFYRAKVKEKPQIYNMWMGRQFSILHKLSKNIPVIITNQVYSKIDRDKIEMVGGEMFRNWSKRIIKLEKDPGALLFEKPLGGKMNFEIKENGIFKLK